MVSIYCVLEAVIKFKEKLRFFSIMLIMYEHNVYIFVVI